MNAIPTCAEIVQHPPETAFNIVGSAFNILRKTRSSSVGIRTQEYESARASLYPLAQFGHSRAIALMAGLEAMGWGGPANELEADNWLSKLPKQSAAIKKFEIAERYLAGLGTELNREKALRWLKSSADDGYAPAIDRLARPISSSAHQTRSGE